MFGAILAPLGLAVSTKPHDVPDNVEFSISYKDRVNSKPSGQFRYCNFPSICRIEIAINNDNRTDTWTWECIGAERDALQITYKDFEDAKLIMIHPHKIIRGYKFKLVSLETLNDT